MAHTQLRFSSANRIDCHHDVSEPATAARRRSVDGLSRWGFLSRGQQRRSHRNSPRPALSGLAGAEPRIVWRDDNPARCRKMWAPEFHLLDGPHGRRWYLYYCAAPADETVLVNHRLYVLEGQGGTPLGPYEGCGELDVSCGDNFWGIDASVFALQDGRLFLLWAGAPGHRLFIAPLENPWSLCGPRVNLEASGFGDKWLREGPVALRRGGWVWLFYSVCDAQSADYKVGIIWADERADLLDPRSWEQHPTPVLARCDERGVWGPGHNGFFRSPDGREDWIVYHAKTGAEWGYSNRVPCAQKISWTTDGWPLIGEPVGFGRALTEPSGVD